MKVISLKKIDISYFTLFIFFKNIYFNPTKIKTNDGGEKLECMLPPPEYGPWKLYHIFYAFSPMIRPIPTGLKLINALSMGKYPYSTKHVKHAYDPFDIQPKSISFMTWTQPVPGTVPLYLHISPFGDSYPSFDKKPPSEGNWTMNIMSPLYVLNSNSLNWKTDKNGEPIFLFKGIDNRCLPNENGVSIEECFLKTDEDILHTNINFGPTPLLTTIKTEIKSSRKLHILIVIGVTIFALLLIVCIIIFCKSKRVTQIRK